ncbi:hypothetical protein MASR1M90_02890 [Desulfovibrionales bacterium]
MLLTSCVSRKTEVQFSQVPVSASYPLSTQQLMQAAHHWDVFAERMAKGMAQAYENFYPDDSVSVYVAPGGSTPFAKAFYQLLTTQLVQHGIPLAAGPEGNIVADFDTMLVHHRNRLVRTPEGYRRIVEPGFRQHKNDAGKYVALPLVNEDSATYTEHATKTELLVTCTFARQGAIVFRDTGIFYVNPKEVSHYVAPVQPGPLPLKQYILQE